MKKILICCNVYPPLFIGGAELIAHMQGKKLQDLGHSVTVFTGDIQEGYFRHSLRKEDYDNLPVFRVCLTFEDFQIEKVNFYHKVVEEHFSNLLDELSPDVVHFHNIIGLSTGIIHIAKQRGVKTIMTLHDHWGFCLKNTLVRSNGDICLENSRCSECLPFISDQDIHQIPIQMRKDYIDIQFRDIDTFISPSQYLATAYINAGFPETKFQVIWNGIDVNHFSSIKSKVSLKKVRFTFIGHFGRHKGIHVLLDALPFLSNVREKYFINLVGSGDIMEECKEKVREMGLQSSVKIWGKIQNIDDVYRETDVLILPSIWPENQPVTITEAMANGKPVIASNLGGIPELVDDGKTGYLFEVGNSEELSQKMMEFIKNREKIEKLGKAGYLKVASNTVENQVKKIITIYNYETREKNRSDQNEVLIACAGKQISYHCIQTIKTMKNRIGLVFQFVLANWLQKDLYKDVKVIWVMDSDAKIDDNITTCLKHGIPLLVPENNISLKKFCTNNKCGLFYKDAIEAQACLEYLAEENIVQKLLGENGRQIANCEKLFL